MAGIGLGQEQNDRSQVEPSFLLSGDPGYAGGGTVMSGDTNAMMSSYENVFGPAARDIKWDQQRHKRHQRWHLPDALKGSNSFLTDRIDGLITDATSSPFTKSILPYMYMDQPDRKIKWNVYSFDEGIAARVPYESAARVLPQSKRSFAGYAVRQGLAIAMEHNFMMSPQGMDNFRRQLLQLVGSIQLTNDLDVHMALLHAPSYQKHMDEKYWDGTKPLTAQCRMYVDLFGFVQKNDNALDYLIEDAKTHLTAWGSKPPTFMLCNGALTRQLTMTPERTNYITAGPDGKRKLAQGPDLPSYRGLNIINTRQFSLEAGAAPRDMLRRRVRVSEHYRIPWDVSNMRKRYEFYDQSRDSMFYLSWIDLHKASLPEDRLVLDAVPDIQAFPDGRFWEMDTLADRPEDRTVDEGAANYATITDAAQDGSLRARMFTKHEVQLAALLGIWSGWTTAETEGVALTHPVKFEQDIEIVISTTDANGRPTFSTLILKAEWMNTHVWFHLFGHWVMKQYLKNAIFTGFMSNVQVRGVAHCTDIMHILFPQGAAWHRGRAPFHGLNEPYHDMQQPSLIVGLSALFNYMHIAQFAAAHNNCHSIKSWKLDQAAIIAGVQIHCLATDLFLLRPNIEHHMLALIFGRGGGPEELGATFWGQTELSCYDDSQHGIWGMSYKYHERAIVINERNLIRVFDVCFDGYCGGNDAQIVRWETRSCAEFKQATENLTTPYSGPSMLVMSLPKHTNVYESFPNPIVWHPKTPHQSRMRVVPDKGGQANGLDRHAPFSNDPRNTPGVHRVYSMYFKMLDLNIDDYSQALDPGAQAVANETDPYVFSFHGHMTSILDGQREETHGSGHLGSNFVGVASVREGRGMLPRGMPSLQHLV